MDMHESAWNGILGRPDLYYIFEYCNFYLHLDFYSFLYLHSCMHTCIHVYCT